MSGIGWALGVGAAVLAVAAVSSGSGGGTVAPPVVKDTRFVIKRNVIDPAYAAPLFSYAKGDVLNVTLHDNKTGADIPFLVTVDNVLKDGMDAVYNGITTVLDLSPGTHFVVYPADVISKLPVTPTDTTPLTHTLDAGDVAMGPAAFAALTGFENVTEFLLFNNGTFVDSVAPDTAAGEPGIYITGSIPFLVYHRVTPWAVGVNAKIKKAPALTMGLPKMYAPVFGELAPPQYGRAFGSRSAHRIGV